VRDLHNNITVDKALETIVVNNDTEGTGAVIDLKGFEAAEMIVDVGQSGDVLSGALKFDLILQHGDLANGTDQAAVAQTDVLGSWAAGGIFATIDDPAEDGAVFAVGYRGSKRYVRLFIDTTGTHTNGTPIGAVCVKAKARHLGGNAV
jgi:hypothetical protein